jgi:hydrogenase maturation protein HypF
MLSRRLNCPRTSSAGRLFDAVASIANLRQTMTFEGQAAMELEFAARRAAPEKAYPIRFVPGASAEVPMQFDWAPMILGILDDLKQGTRVEQIASNFHNTLVEVIVQAASRMGQLKVVLTGGCFQNRLLLERSVERLREEGFQPYWHQRVPPNDGGISLGQVAAAMISEFVSQNHNH